MRKLISFFWFCSGAETEFLKRCPSETAKYTGIGATIFFTGVFAVLSASYALYTVFDSVWAALAFGLVWGLMIFNLDRFIVSSMRKEGRTMRELAMASPRIVLASGSRYRRALSSFCSCLRAISMHLTAPGMPRHTASLIHGRDRSRRSGLISHTGWCSCLSLFHGWHGRREIGWRPHQFPRSASLNRTHC